MTLTTQHTIDCATNQGGDCDCPMGLQLSETMDLRGIIGNYTTTAYTYEDEFLKEFCEGTTAKDLLEVYLDANRTKIVIAVESGTVISKTISTVKFLEWADVKNGVIKSG